MTTAMAGQPAWTPQTTNESTSVVYSMPSLTAVATGIDNELQTSNMAQQIAVTTTAVVLKCYSCKFKRYVAIKIINTRLIPPALSEKFISRELGITAELHHPFIIRCLCVYKEVPTRIVIVTDYAEGGTLLAYLLQRQRLPEYEAARLFRQLAEAVNFLHVSYGVAHRDIKLENVLLDRFCNVKLADFGFARPAQAACRSTSFCGTRPYSCPQLVDHVEYSPFMADWYACGILLYTILAGTWPHSPEETIAYPVFYPDVVPVAARPLLDCLLEKDESKRGTFADICGSAWLTWLTNDGAWMANT